MAMHVLKQQKYLHFTVKLFDFLCELFGCVITEKVGPILILTYLNCLPSKLAILHGYRCRCGLIIFL